MSKKTKTPTEQQKSLKGWSRLCFFGEFVSVFTPFITIGLVNYEKYFIQYNGTKISIGFALAMIVMGIATWLVAEKNFENSFVTILVAWALVTGILFLIQEILSDLCYIMLFGFLGIAGAYGLDIGKQKLNKKAEKIQQGIELAEQEQIKNAHMADVEEKEKAKTVKVRVKK